MTDLAATDLTITVLSKGIAGKKRRNYGSLAFGDGSLTWPAAGLVVTDAQFGFLRQTDQITFQGMDGYRLEYDKANKLIQMFWSDLNGSADGPDVVATGATPASHTVYWDAIGL